MAIAQNNLILAADYNGIQTNVNDTLGTGSGDRGYGQAVTSAQVTAGNLITAQHMINLKTDLDKISFHQTNSASSAPSVSVGGTILASNWLTYSSQISSLTTSRLTIFGVSETAGASPITTAQSTWLLDVVTSSISNWNTTRSHAVTVDFGSLNGARYFFNTGGEIRIVPRHSGESSSVSKGGRWKNMFSSFGIRGVRLGANSTQASSGGGVNSTIATSTGYYQLGTSNVAIITSTDTGTYSGNEFKVQARKDATGRYVYFDISFGDIGLTGNIDDAVDGTTTSSIGSFRATGSYVSVAAPTITAVAM